ncbi:hypothetical protein ABZ719_31950 [Streptomyces sp. NPDC006743]|uniref:hypothetical protein n=1 Tax=Streptomyces sp. NPDC006743 TaxID=3154480 RepID=UPI0034566BF8
MTLKRLYSRWAHLVPGRSGLVLACQKGKLEKSWTVRLWRVWESCVFLRHSLVPEPAS